MKPKLDQFHYHEMTDRASILLDMLDRFISSHPVAESDPLLKQAIEQAEESLHSLYQVATDVEEKNS